jgi:hypothetical protein
VTKPGGETRRNQRTSTRVGRARMTGRVGTVPPAVNEQFETYEAFQNWLGSSYPEGISTTAKGRTFRDFVAQLLPETTRGRRFGRLKANPKHSHDFGVDVLSADPSTDQLALQSRFFVGEKGHIDGIISQFRNYEARLQQTPDGQLFTDRGPAVPRPV